MLNVIDKFIFAGATLLIVFLLNASGNGSLATTYFIPLLFIWVFIQRGGLNNSLFRAPMVYFLCFVFLSFFSVLYSIDSLASLTTQLKFTAIVLFSLGVYLYSINKVVNIKLVYAVNIIVFVLLVWYFKYLNVGTYFDETSRLEDTVISANTYGYYIFNGIFAFFILTAMVKSDFVKLFLFAFFVYLAYQSLFIILFSASRGAFLIWIFSLIGNLFIILFTYFKSTFIKVIVFFLLFIFFSMSTSYFSSITSEDIYLFERFASMEDNETPREYHVKKALEIGSENFLFGVGSGGYAIVPKSIEQGSFSHNTFTEIFANFGIIGLSVYIFFWSSLMKMWRKAFKVSNNEKTVLYIVCFYFIIFNLYSTLYVVYLSNIFMHLLFVVCAHIVTIINRSEKLSYAE